MHYEEVDFLLLDHDCSWSKLVALSLQITDLLHFVNIYWRLGLWLYVWLFLGLSSHQEWVRLAISCYLNSLSSRQLLLDSWLTLDNVRFHSSWSTIYSWTVINFFPFNLLVPVFVHDFYLRHKFAMLFCMPAFSVSSLCIKFQFYVPATLFQDQREIHRFLNWSP